MAGASWWIVGLGLAGLPGCGSGEPEAPEDPVVEAQQERLMGAWKLLPQDEDLRRMRVIEAALSGRPDKRRALGSLDKDEDALFETWAAERGEAVSRMKARLRFLEGGVMTFGESEEGEPTVTVAFGTDVYGPVTYQIAKAEEDVVVLTFDPGLGTGVETHEIRWSGPNRGLSSVTSTKRGELGTLRIQRR